MNHAKFPLLSKTLPWCLSLLRRKGILKVPSDMKQGGGGCAAGAMRETPGKVRSSELGEFCSQEHIFICPSSTGVLPGLGFSMHTLCQESAQPAYETIIDSVQDSPVAKLAYGHCSGVSC